jgi:cytochrome c-type biogenesis protein CcmH/NrfG
MEDGPKDPDGAQIWFKKGNDHLNSGDYQDAVDSFTKAIQINPKELRHGTTEASPWRV